MNLDADTREQYRNAVIRSRKGMAMLRYSAPGGLMAFIKDFWSILEPQTPFRTGWVLAAMCEHLEAVSNGEITRLLINVPPGFMKSLLVDVFWPAWEWAVHGAHLRYVTFSYSAEITERDNDKFGTLVSSPLYQDLFGDRVHVNRLGKRMVANIETGWKFASSVGGVGTGQRGDRVILDDPHNVKDQESEVVRNETTRWFREAMSNRLNDMESGVIVVIMQRLHGDDVSGVILDLGMDYVHLMIPMEYEYDRQTDENFNPRKNAVDWYDPRYDEYDPKDPDDILAWPERFPRSVVENRIKVDGGPYAWAGQYQQNPVPRGGGIFKKDWWQVWDDPQGRFPVVDYVLVSVDSAFTAKERNDPTGCTVWGLFQSKEGKRRVICLHAWRKHLEFSAARDKVEALNGESYQQWVQRTQRDWGLMEWLRHTCRRFKADHLLIEGKASGISAAQEIVNRYGRESWAVQLCKVEGDKESRALSCVATFSQLMVYAPVRDWAEMLIEEMENFPKHKYDDLTDSATQAIRFFRANGMLLDDAETEAIEREAVTHFGKKKELAFW